MKSFTFTTDKLTLRAQPDNFRYEVILNNGETWLMAAKPYVKFANGIHAEFPAPSPAEQISSGTGYIIKCVYSGFEGSDIVAVTHIRLNKTTSELSFMIDVTGDRPGEIEHISYPAPFEFGADEGHGYTVLPRMQGVLIPAGYPIPTADGLIYERDGYMPLFGQVRDGSGYAAVFDTPFDVKYKPDGDRIAPLWRPSLGKMEYPRIMLYSFYENCDHNTIAKRYRTYLKERGKLVTLKEKAIKNPEINRIIGSAVIHSSIACHIAEESMFYDKEHPENNDNYVSFEERARQLERLHFLGLDNAYTHFDGWGYHGYDNLHPSPFPPNENAGGAEGMKHLSDTCKKIGYVFGIHDQYRDYYYDNPDFDIGEAVTYADGGHPFHTVWNGGAHTFLCSELAPDYVKRNYSEFDRLGIRIDAAYLDVFSVVELDECYSPNHRTTRRRCAENRRACLDYLNNKGVIPSSEEATDCIVPSIALCHHAPFYCKELGGMQSEADGIPIPLFELVYHDCLIVPWIGLPGERAGWGIPVNDSAYLYGILYGCPVYCPIDAEADDIAAVNLACKHAGKLAHTEMIKHEFIDGDFRKQRTLFSNGTAVEADLDTLEYKIIN